MTAGITGGLVGGEKKKRATCEIHCGTALQDCSGLVMETEKVERVAA